MEDQPKLDLQTAFDELYSIPESRESAGVIRVTPSRLMEEIQTKAKRPFTRKELNSFMNERSAIRAKLRAFNSIYTVYLLIAKS